MIFWRIQNMKKIIPIILIFSFLVFGSAFKWSDSESEYFVNGSAPYDGTTFWGEEGGDILGVLESGALVLDLNDDVATDLTFGKFVANGTTDPANLPVRIHQGGSNESLALKSEIRSYRCVGSIPTCTIDIRLTDGTTSVSTWGYSTSGTSPTGFNLGKDPAISFNVSMEILPEQDIVNWSDDEGTSWTATDISSLDNAEEWFYEVYMTELEATTQIMFNWIKYLGPIPVFLDAPDDGSFQNENPVSFNATLNSPENFNITNATLYIWNSTGGIFNNSETNFITGKTNTTSFDVIMDIGEYTWNVLGTFTNGTNNIQHFFPSNYSFTYGFSIDSRSYDVNLTNGKLSEFELNITTANTADNDFLGFLVWNNTSYEPSKTILNSSSISYSYDLVIPAVGNTSGVTIPHYWNIYDSDGSFNISTDSVNQNVFSLGIDNCTTFSQLLLNYTLYDEGSVTLINGTNLNSSIEVEVTITSLADTSITQTLAQTFSSVNNAQICVNSIDTGFRVDSQARYFTEDHVVEFHNIQNSTLSTDNFPQNIDLFDLLSTESQEFLVTFKDSSFTPVENALITVTRKYVGEGLFRTVEAPLTNSDGQAIIHLVLGDLIYTIEVSKDGVLLGTFDNIVPFCSNIATGDCTINLNAFSSGTEPSDFETYKNVSYRFDFDRGARTITPRFNTLDGSVRTFNLTSTVFDNRGNNTVCSSTITTSSGSIDCVIPISVGNTTVEAILYQNDEFVARGIFNLQDSSSTGFGYTGIIMMALLYITIPLMMITSGAGIVIGAILGLIFASMLNLYIGGGIIGLGSTILWFIIAGGVILWKINSLKSA